MGAHQDDVEASWPWLEPARPLPADDVLVVAVELAHVVADEALLDAAARERAAGFRDGLLRQRHVAAHTAVRRLLGWRLGTDPGGLVITADHHGKPALRDHPLVFNLSHSGGWALIAMAGDGMLGVDLELGEHLQDTDRLAARLFAAEALAAFEALPPAMRTAAFLTAWARKEAALKALGLGLPGGMEHVLIAERPVRLRGDFTRLPGLASLHLHDLPGVGGGAAALCQGPRRRPLVCRRWPVVATTATARPSPSAPLI